MESRLMRWVARWLDRRGLTDVADVLDGQVAGEGNTDAMHALARRALARGDAAGAIAQLKTAIDLRPNDPTLWCTLGAAYRRVPDLDAARDAYEHALSLKPEYPEALSNLGEWCIFKNRYEEALDWFTRALACDPDFFEARLNRVAALFEASRFDDARAAAEELVADEPERAEPLVNLGNVLVHTGNAKRGIQSYKKAIELCPENLEARYNLATLLAVPEELAGVIGYIERQIRERGESAQTLGFLAAAHQAAGHIDKAADLCRRIIERQPDSIIALSVLATCLSLTGDAAAAVELYERIVAVDPNQMGMYSNIVFESNNVAGLERAALFKRHCDWAERFEAPVRGSGDDFPERNRDPDRKLRIGYVSGDFVTHPVGFLLRDILRRHSRSEFEVYCFSMVIREADVLPDVRQATDHWEDVFYLNDDDLAKLVRDAGIDILIDLSGHTAFHRLAVFARKPAPVQFEWIGYFHSTGLSSIDYFITDPYTTPPGGGQLFSETPVYLPHTRFCYAPPDYAPAVVPPPGLESGVVTFGSFNRLTKMTDQVVSAWATILKAVPRSRLVLKARALSEESVRKRIAERFAAEGVTGDRIDLRESSSHQQMLAEYGDIDIALDTFPFNGGMTTLEALWMGVPVVTIAGNTVVSRQTVAVLSNIGLAGELAFRDRDSFVKGAIALAQDPTRMARLRSELRPRMAASPLRQADQFTRDVESLFRRAWRAYCRGQRLPSDAERES